MVPSGVGCMESFKLFCEMGHTVTDIISLIMERQFDPSI